MTDLAHTPDAEARRTAKALKLATWCWDRGITAAELAAARPEQLSGVARKAGVNPPRPGSTETWDETRRLVRAKADWAAANPGHPRAVRVHVRACCICRPIPCAIDDSGDACTGCAVCMNGCPAPTPETCCHRTAAGPNRVGEPTP